MTGRGSVVRGAAGAVLAVLALLAPLLSAEYVLSLLTLMLITALLATSVNMPAGEVGLVSMGHAGIAAAAAYGVAYGVKHGFGLGVQLLLALALTLLVSAVYAATTMRTNGIVFLMITLALGVMVYGVALKWSAVTGGQSGLTGIQRPDAFRTGPAFYYFVLAVCVLVVLLLHLFARSPLGLMLRGIRDSEHRMSSLGYAIAPAKFVAVMVSGVVAGVAGVLLVWHSEFMSPATAAFERSAMAVVIIIIGGIGSVMGPLLGAVLVVGIQYWLSSYLERWPTLLGALFIAVVIFLPGGLASMFRRGTARPAPGTVHPALDALLPSGWRRRTHEVSAPPEPPVGSPAIDRKGEGT
ncbi:MAG TPA: branched-chain amino acid ABC transporter permease [Nakamurella sp.]|jgi:branched-chain amino acid transport system permease protein|nr:branched-chain amino acid ABC transporter permease [Nakamurella sp.]